MRSRPTFIVEVGATMRVIGTDSGSNVTEGKDPDDVPVYEKFTLSMITVLRWVPVTRVVVSPLVSRVASSSLRRSTRTKNGARAERSREPPPCRNSDDSEHSDLFSGSSGKKPVTNSGLSF